MKQSLKVLLTISLGNAMLAFSICAFVIPYDIMLGGSNGIALAIQHLALKNGAVKNSSVFCISLLRLRFLSASGRGCGGR